MEEYGGNRLKNEWRRIGRRKDTTADGDINPGERKDKSAGRGID